MLPVRVAVRLRVCLAQLDREASLWLLIAYDNYGLSVAIAEGLAVGPIVRFKGASERGAFENRLLSGGSPPKIGVGEEFWPVFGP